MATHSFTGRGEVREENNQEKLSSASAHPQNLSPSISPFLACQQLPEQNPMLLTVNGTASVLTSPQNKSALCFSSAVLPGELSPVVCSGRQAGSRWECSFRDAPLLPLPPRAELVSTTDQCCTARPRLDHRRNSDCAVALFTFP